MSKKVSILLTSYNLVDFIDESVSSVLNMDMPFDWELIIGDDGSSDGTVEKIKKWVDKFPYNIKLIEIDRTNEKVKTGSRAAHNRAMLLENAVGEYINFLDGDDFFLGTEKIVRQVEFLDNIEYQDCSCCAHNIEAYNILEQRKYLMCKSTIPKQKYTIERYWKYQYFHTNTILFRRKCAVLMLDPIYRNYLNDNFITFLALQFGKILYLPNVWARYNMTGSGLWTGHSRVYGKFRNMQIVDLQLYLRSDLKSVILFRHRNDIKTIRCDYKEEMIDEIRPLISNLDPQIFSLTLLLAKKSGLSIKERLTKMRLFICNDLRIMMWRVTNRLK